jgi:HlyD family secretion protein
MRLRRSISGAIALLAMATLSACNGHEEPHYLGYVEAEWTYVSAPAAGRIVEQPVREGDTVEAGTFLFRLDDTAEEAALAQANAQLDRATAEAENLETGARAPEIRQFQAQLREAEVRLAKAVSDRDRMLPLVEQGLAPETRADEVISAVEAAEASVEAARQQIIVASLPGRPATRSAADAAALSAEAARITAEYRLSERTVSAPAGGRIEEVFFRPGEYVVPGATVLAILPQHLMPHGALLIQTLHPLTVISGNGIYADGWREDSWAAFSEEVKDPPPWYFRTLGSWVALLHTHRWSIHQLHEPLDETTGRPASLIIHARRQAPAGDPTEVK